MKNTFNISKTGIDHLTYNKGVMIWIEKNDVKYPVANVTVKESVKMIKEYGNEVITIEARVYTENEKYMARDIKTFTKRINQIVDTCGYVVVREFSPITNGNVQYSATLKKK